VLAAARSLSSVRGIVSPRLSSLYETDPVGEGYTRAFVNAVMILEARINPHTLLEECLAIERGAGRRPERGDRPLDVDVILFGEVRSADPPLLLPHPRMLERLFVLRPLAELAPDLLLPPDGIPAAEAADRLRDGPGVRRISSRSIISVEKRRAGS
jgi:2-amino-4-hydroxy-6-hydroxymethyldihydropteridine diphosphokinase